MAEMLLASQTRLRVCVQCIYIYYYRKVTNIIFLPGPLEALKVGWTSLELWGAGGLGSAGGRKEINQASFRYKWTYLWP